MTDDRILDEIRQRVIEEELRRQEKINKKKIVDASIDALESITEVLTKEDIAHIANQVLKEHEIQKKPEKAATENVSNGKKSIWKFIFVVFLFLSFSYYVTSREGVIGIVGFIFGLMFLGAPSIIVIFGIAYAVFTDKK